MTGREVDAGKTLETWASSQRNDARCAFVVINA